MILENTYINEENTPEITAKDLNSQTKKVRLIDVRRPDEFTGELGHIKNAELFTLGPDLENFLQTADKAQIHVFICRSGKRSASATQMAKEKGIADVYNMAGGMLAWNASGYSVER